MHEVLFSSKNRMLAIYRNLFNASLRNRRPQMPIHHHTASRPYFKYSIQVGTVVFENGTFLNKKSKIIINS